MESKTTAPEVKDSPAKKKSQGKKSKLQKKNIDKAAKKAKDEEEESSRELLYNYPADVKTASDKKTWRRQFRAKRDSLLKKIAKARKDDMKEARKLFKELNEHLKESCTQSGIDKSLQGFKALPAKEKATA